MEVDPEIVSEAIKVTSNRQSRSPEPELPHSLVTDKILAERMDAIGHHAKSDDELEPTRGFGDRLGDRARGKSLEQDRFNSNVTHIFHQLDHRDRQQRAQIVALHEELAKSLSRIDALERRLARLEQGAK